MKIFGHPLHVIVVGPTQGVLISAAALDLCYWFTRETFWLTATVWILSLALAFAAIAIFAGLFDFITLAKENSENKDQKLKIAIYHMMVMLTCISLSVFSLILRLTNHTSENLLASILLYLGVLLIPLGGWLGGELILRYRMGSK